MRIGELSRRTGVGIQTLRFYEREKLLREPPRTPSGYRAYTDADLERVQFILEAQKLGFTLRDIHELLQIHMPGSPKEHTKPPADRWPDAFQIARQRLSLIDERIEQLQAFRKRLADGLESASRQNFAVCPASASTVDEARRPASDSKCPARQRCSF